MKTALIRIGGTVSSFVPLAAYVGINWNNIVTTSAQGWSLTIGGIMVIIIVAIQLAGKIGKILGNGFAFAAFSYVLVLLLQPVLAQLDDILLCVLIGQGVNNFAFIPLADTVEKGEEKKAKSEETERLITAIQENISGRA